MRLRASEPARANARQGGRIRPMPRRADSRPLPRRQATSPARSARWTSSACVRDIDLALHLPLRYEDETRLVPIAEPARRRRRRRSKAWCATAEVEFRGRAASSWCACDDGSDELVLRFLHFYPSHQKTLAVGTRVRVRGEVRGGFFGREMVHPTFKAGRPKHAAGRPR